MPVKIRLSRHGRKKRSFFHIVVADGRAPRDGKYIEKLGYYNPNTNPATIEINFDEAVNWLQKGAQPTETCRTILSYKGVLFKNHLIRGVKKGAFTEEVAEEKFNDWLEDKEAKIQAKRDEIADEAKKDSKKRLAQETKVNEARAQAIAKKNSDIAKEAEAAIEAAKEAEKEATEAKNVEETENETETKAE
jgi:small subunit ribosomal protein S16